MKFVMTQAVVEEGMKKLEGVADVYVANDQDPNHYLDQMQDADALIVRIAKCDRHAIEHSPQLKVIGRTGVGYDSVDVAAATERGIPVVITPGANNRSVAEHTVALMFALSKNLVEGQLETHEGNYDSVRSKKKAFELLGKTVGFIGFGAIGREAQAICRGIGMKTAAYDPFLSKVAIEEQGARYYATVEDLIADCDIVSIHVPLTSETRDLFTMKEFRTMKPTALLINCARGGIINEADLFTALCEGLIAGAGLDVFEEEPPKKGYFLLDAPNLIYSPHSAAQTREAVINMAEQCVEGCLAILRGDRWPYVANPAAYDHPRWTVK